MKPQIRQIREFIIGFIGWFVFYSLFWGFVEYAMGVEEGVMMLLCLPSPRPITYFALIFLILLSFFTLWRWIPLGALSAFAVNSIGLILLGLAPYALSGVPFFFQWFTTINDPWHGF